jgi:hypothetical protein
VTASRERPFVRAVALIVLVGAILPNVTYIGHWTIRSLEAPTAEANADGHTNHCHGVSSCADQAAYGLQWWDEGHGGVVLDGGPERAVAPGRAPSAADAVVSPLDPPPKYV